MKKNWFKNKKIILSLIGATALTAVPIIATSCSSTTTKELIDKSYFTSSDGKLTSKIDLKRISLESLKTNEGLKSYLKSVVNKIVYNWLQETIKTDNKLKVEYENKIKEINDEYDNQIETYKNQHGDNWQIKFQQDLLDKNGGTEQTYKDAKIYEYARSTFSSQIFKNLFLTVFDSSTKKVILNPTNEQILDGLYGISNTTKTTTSAGTKEAPKITYKFDSNAILTSNTTTDPMYAEFQQYLFDQYVELTNPYIINMSLWKYGTPKSGINSYYNIQTSSGDSGGSEDGDSSGGSEGGSGGSESNGGATVREGEDSGSGDTSGDTGTTTTTSGSYIYPYFGDENATNTSNGTVTKFTNFLSGSLTTKNYITNNDLGLKDIPLNLTDDSSTYILAKNSSIFNDLYTEFAAGATYLYGKLGATGTGGTNRTNADFQSSNIDAQITHDIDISTASTEGLDNITRNFVSKSDLYTTTSSYVNGTSSADNVKKLTLPNDLVKQIVNANGPINKLIETSTSSTTNKVHVIDSFVPGTIKVTSTSTNNNANNDNTKTLSEYLFLRNQAGVHAISIDGSTLINKATNEKDRKKHAGYVVMYRHLMGSKGMGQSFKIDLSNELNTFFGSNADWLIYQYATSSNPQKLLNANFLSENEKNLSTNISDLTKHLNYYDGVSTATEKMYDAKNTYNANYGYNTYLNGFASNWNYKLSATSKNGLNKSYLYENALLSSTIASPYEKKGDEQSLYEKTLKSVETLLNSLDLSKQVSNFEGFKYSQYLYTSNEFVNGSLLTFMSNTGQLSALIRNDAYKTYISDFYNIENNNFKASINNSGLSNGLYNFFYLNLLNSEKIKWLRYDESTKATGTNNLSNIRNYSYSLWKNSGDKDYGTKLTNYSHLYSVVATIKYLTDNNYSRFLEYLRTSIGTNKAFIVWENSINTNLKNLQTTTNTTSKQTTPTTPITSKSLIEMTDDKLTKNVNNSYGGNYVGNLTTINDNNVDSSGFYQTQYNTSFYSVTGNGSGSSTSSNYKIGFKGLQTSTNSSLQSDVTEAIFTKPYNFNIGYNGVLAQYKSKEEIIKLIKNSATINTLTTIANSLDAALNYQFLLSEDINNPNTTLNEKKAILVEKVNTFNESYFQSYSGYIGAKQVTQNASNNNNDNSNAFSTTEGSVNLYGSFVYQITQKDLVSYESLKTALKSETLADDIIMQLIVQAANQPSLQSEIATKIALSNKFDVYDVRVKDALATDAIYWIKNWKG